MGHQILEFISTTIADLKVMDWSAAMWASSPLSKFEQSLAHALSKYSSMPWFAFAIIRFMGVQRTGCKKLAKIDCLVIIDQCRARIYNWKTFDWSRPIAPVVQTFFWYQNIEEKWMYGKRLVGLGEGTVGFASAVSWVLIGLEFDFEEQVRRKEIDFSSFMAIIN